MSSKQSQIDSLVSELSVAEMTIEEMKRERESGEITIQMDDHKGGGGGKWKRNYVSIVDAVPMCFMEVKILFLTNFSFFLTFFWIGAEPSRWPKLHENSGGP